MNKLNKLFLTACVALSFYSGLNAQSKIPQFVSFQAVARDDNNKPIIKKPIGVQLTVRQGGPDGSPVYGAYYQDSTNEFGEFTRLLGSKAKNPLNDISDKFSTIPWEKGDMWLVIDYQTSLTGSFKPMAKIQFIAQPYAFASGTAEKLTTSGVTGQILTHDGTNWVAKDAPKLAVVATSGSYNDLTNKPSEATYASLKDKPTLATVATSGSYNDLTNKPTIPSKTSELKNDAAFGVFMPGMIIPWAGDYSTVPAGWMLCDGRVLNKTDYPDLFNVIQTFYGNANGTAGSFQIPDFQGMFLRGASNGSRWSDGTQKDPDAEYRESKNGSNYGDKVGSYQGDAFQGHKHEMSNALTNETKPYIEGVLGNKTGFTGGVNFYGTGAWAWSNIAVQKPIADDTNGTPRTSAETRPQNISINYIIRVK
jgi:microcystin-dependent protein